MQRHLRELVDVGHHVAVAEAGVDAAQDRVAEGQDRPRQDEPQERAQGADEQALQAEERDHLQARGAERGEHADLAGAADDGGEERAADRERSDERDDEHQEEEHRLLEADRLEEVALDRLPRAEDQVGVADVEAAGDLLGAGADKVSINSAALDRPGLVTECAERHGSQCIVVAIDAKQTSPGVWEVFTHGGRKNAGINAIAWAQEVAKRGAGEILLTSMDRDGTKNGFDLALTRAVSDAVSVPVIASGGVGNLQHLADGIKEGHADAVLAASIFHFGEYTVGQAKQLMANQGIPVRL